MNTLWELQQSGREGSTGRCSSQCSRRWTSFTRSCWEQGNPWLNSLPSDSRAKVTGGRAAHHGHILPDHKAGQETLREKDLGAASAPKEAVQFLIHGQGMLGWMNWTEPAATWGWPPQRWAPCLGSPRYNVQPPSTIWVFLSCLDIASPGTPLSGLA